MFHKSCLSAVIIAIFAFDLVFMKSSDNQSEFLEKQRKKLTEKGSKCTLKKLNIRNLDHLRLTSKDTKAAILCILEAMKEKEQRSSGILWTTLGTLYNRVAQKTQSTTCFKQAAKLAGKISTYVNDWSFLGPFVIGKMEVDGDPVESFGGIVNVSLTRYKKNVKYFSELVPGGEIQWSHIKQASADKAVAIKTAVNWNELVNSLGSMAITEWQGWVVGEFAVNENDHNIQVQCLGVHTVFIDNVPITGDVYHRNRYWYGVNLNQGLHTVYIKLRTKVHGQFLCKFQIAQNSFELLAPNYLPDLLDGYLFSNHIAVPVANFHHSNFLKISKVILTNMKSKSAEILNNLDVLLEYPGELVAPGQVSTVILKLKSRSSESNIIAECSKPESSWDIELQLKFTTSAGVSSLPVSIRCRHSRQSFLFTFLDHDGSVQHAAAIQPREGCAMGSCPTLMSLHGTSISPQNQADGYKYMAQGESDFQFGFNNVWTLAPTRHGAHNWEGPGLLTAVTALDSLGELTLKAEWITNVADPKHVVFAGHSMGGHGAWHVAAHYPDRSLALVSLAGWIKKEDYGDSNMFFRHDIATSHVEPAVKSVLESCIVENDADQHVTNLQGVPVVTRIGALDRTVHPWFVRRMYRLLKEDGIEVNYTEVKDKDHWWWDTVKTNDGGAVNDQYLRDFTSKYADNFAMSSEATCTEYGCSKRSQNKIYSEKVREVSFRLVCYNPALGEGMYGVRVLQQITPYRRSEIKGELKDDEIKLSTRNVLRLSLSASPNRNIDWEEHTVTIDDTEGILVELKQNGQISLCLKSGGWSVCNEEINTLTARGPLTLGPARRIAESPFRIIIGTTGSPESQLYIQQAAVYIANLFFLTADAHVDILRDVDIKSEELDSSNVIIIGSSAENRHTDAFLKHIPVSVSKDGVTVQSCNFHDPRTALLSLAPNGNTRLALLLIGTSREGLQDLVSLATPTIPPMTRSPFSNLVPDFVITGPEFGRKGPGGYLCAGFYGNHWEYRPDLSSCVCV